jgi:hypothetical protein
MRIPYSIQGALFAPACAVLIFVLKITCPAPSGVGCFADPFIRPLFFPVPFFYAVFGNMRTLMYHEPFFVLGYWMIVGLLVGALYDIYRKQEKL